MKLSGRLVRVRPAALQLTRGGMNGTEKRNLDGRAGRHPAGLLVSVRTGGREEIGKEIELHQLPRKSDAGDRQAVPLREDGEETRLLLLPRLGASVGKRCGQG